MENVLVALIQAECDPGHGVNLYRSFDVAAGAVRVAYPCIGVHCPGSRPQDPEMDGTSGLVSRYVSCRLMVKTWPADQQDAGTVIATAREQHDELVGLVMDLMHDNTVVDKMNAQNIPRIGVNQIDLPVEGDLVIEDGAFTTPITFDALTYSKEG